MKDYQIEKSHGNFVSQWRCCHDTNRNSSGCQSNVIKSYEGGNEFLQVITFGLFGKDKEKYDVQKSHMLEYGEFCDNCWKARGTRECINDVKTEIVQYSEEILKEVKQNYTMDEWNDCNFKQDASKYLSEILEKLDKK